MRQGLSTHNHARSLTIGWIPEGTGWFAPETSKAPVTRMLNPNNGGEHDYTTDAKEVAALEKAGWKDEGVKLYATKLDADTIEKASNNVATEDG